MIHSTSRTKPKTFRRISTIIEYSHRNVNTYSNFLYNFQQEQLVKLYIIPWLCCFLEFFFSNSTMQNECETFMPWFQHFPKCITAMPASRSTVSPTAVFLDAIALPIQKQITQKALLRFLFYGSFSAVYRKCVCNAHIYYTVMWGNCKEKTWIFSKNT